MKRENLYRTLSEKGNPTIETLRNFDDRRTKRKTQFAKKENVLEGFLRLVPI